VPSHVPASPTPHRRRGPSATAFLGTRCRDPIGYRRRATRSIFGYDHSSMILPHVVDFEIGIPSYSPRASRQIPQERSMVGGSEGEDHGWTHRTVGGSRGGGEKGEEAGVDGGCCGTW
jgi:hypothetical protein